MGGAAAEVEFAAGEDVLTVAPDFIAEFGGGLAGNGPGSGFAAGVKSLRVVRGDGELGRIGGLKVGKGRSEQEAGGEAAAGLRGGEEGTHSRFSSNRRGVSRGEVFY